MAITIDWGTKMISIPQADITFISGTLYELDTEWLRGELHTIQASEDGMAHAAIFRHNTEVTIAGVVFSRVIEIINGYMLEFTPDSQWSVRLAGSNNNFFDVDGGILTQNQVQVIAQNSAGLVNPTLTTQEIRDSMDTPSSGGDPSIDDQLSSISTAANKTGILFANQEEIKRKLDERPSNGSQPSDTNNS